MFYGTLSTAIMPICFYSESYGANGDQSTILLFDTCGAVTGKWRLRGVFQRVVYQDSALESHTWSFIGLHQFRSRVAKCRCNLWTDDEEITLEDVDN